MSILSFHHLLGRMSCLSLIIWTDSSKALNDMNTCFCWTLTHFCIVLNMKFFSWNWWYDRIAGERVRFNICFKFTRCRFIDRLGICHRCISNIKYRSRDVWHNLIWYDLVTANIQNIFKLSGPGLSGIFVLCHDKDNGFDNTIGNDNELNFTLTAVEFQSLRLKTTPNLTVSSWLWLVGEFKV